MSYARSQSKEMRRLHFIQDVLAIFSSPVYPASPDLNLEIQIVRGCTRAQKKMPKFYPSKRIGQISRQDKQFSKNLLLSS